MFGTIFYINNKVTSDFSHFFFIFLQIYLVVSKSRTTFAVS